MPKGIEQFLVSLGSWFISLVRTMGHMFLFLMSSLSFLFLPPYKFNVLFRRMYFFGNKSLIIIILTGAFAGMVLSLHIFYTLRQFGSDALLGPAIALSLIRELGPVLSALMVTGRAGSALTAEIGIMRITDQIDAITAMALNPLRYLIIPSMVAAVIIFPLLGAIFNVVGIYGGYLVGVKILNVSPGTFFSQIESLVETKDIVVGSMKSLFFGLIVSWVCCYKGFYTGHGAEGVSRSTTEAVVLSSVLILISDYFIESFVL